MAWRRGAHTHSNGWVTFPNAGKPAQRAWDCGNLVCQAKGIYANRASRSICHICEAPRGWFQSLEKAKAQAARLEAKETYLAAAKAALNIQPQVAASEVPKPKKTRKQRARDAKLRTAAGIAPAEPAATPPSITGPAAPAAAVLPVPPPVLPNNTNGGGSGKVALPAEVLSELALVRPAIQPVLDLLGKEWMPTPKVDEKPAAIAAEDELKKLLEGKAPGADDAPLKAARKNVETLRTTAATPGISEELKKTLEENLAHAEKELDSLEKKAPTQGAHACGVMLAVAEFKNQVQARVDRRRQGKNNAEGRTAQRRQMVVALQAQLGKLTTALEEVDKHCVEAHRLRDLHDEERDQLVLAELERLAARPGGGEISASSLPAHAASTASAGTSTEMATIQAQMAAMQKQHDEKMTAMLAAQTSMHQALKQKAAAEEELARRIPAVTISTLPELNVPPTAELPKYGQLHALLSAWAAEGASTSFTFGELMRHSHFGSEIPFFLRSSLGTSWDKWYQVEPVEGSTVPKQIGELALESLNRLKDAWEKQAEVNKKISEEATGSYAAFLESGKKRRPEALDMIL